MALLPRRHRGTITKVLIAIPILWLVVAFVLYSDRGQSGHLTGGGGGSGPEALPAAAHHQDLKGEFMRAKMRILSCLTNDCPSPSGVDVDARPVVSHGRDSNVINPQDGKRDGAVPRIATDQR